MSCTELDRIGTDDLAVTMLAAVALAAMRATLTRWFAQPATNVRQLFDAHIEVLREGFKADLFAPKPPSAIPVARDAVKTRERSRR